MKRRDILVLAMAGMTAVVGVVFGWRYRAGSWAPAAFQGGLPFKEIPELRDCRGERLPPDDAKEFVRLCASLYSTTRDIGEDSGCGFIQVHSRKGSDHDFLTVYSEMNVLFRGWWIDAKTYSMMDQRAPCYELTPELKQSIHKHNLLSTRADLGP